MGNSLSNCLVNAIVLVEREAVAYNEGAIFENKKKQSGKFLCRRLFCINNYEIKM